MKLKILTMMVLVFLLALPFSVYAQGQQGQVLIRIQEKVNNATQTQNQTQERIIGVEEIDDQIREAPITVIVESQTKGLENAIIHVENQVAVEKLQRNLERFQNKYEYKYNKIDVAEIEGVTVLRAERKIKFLFINFNVEDKYAVDDRGIIIAENRNFWSKFFTRMKTE